MSFPTFLLCGLIPWQFFSAAVSSSVNSLVENQNLVKKVYFPREVIPIAAVLNCLVNFAIGFVVLLAAHAIKDGHVGFGALGMLAVFSIEVMMALGLALLLSSLNAAYHDVQYLTEVVLLFGFYATPIILPLKTIVGDRAPWLWRLLMLNPMTGLTIAYKQLLFDNRFPDLQYLIVPTIAAIFLLVLGAVVFRRRAATLADLL
jgi:ABC-type polysaccharide/polyol phosphate export permease